MFALERFNQTSEYLDLANTMVCDAGLAHLKGLSKLQALDLSRTGVTRMPGWVTSKD